MVDGLPGENMKEMRINGEQIGDSFPTYVVAEAGLNHNGDVETAKKMIESVKNSGVNAIKFQTYKTNNFLTDDSEYYDFFKNVELSFEEFKELKELALSKGFLIVSSSPLTRSSYHADEDFSEMKKLRDKQSQCHPLQ